MESKGRAVFSSNKKYLQYSTPRKEQAWERRSGVFLANARARLQLCPSVKGS